MDIYQEVIDALCTEPTPHPGTSFVSHPKIDRLERHGSALLAAVEKVDYDSITIAGAHHEISKFWVQSNYRLLLVIYYRISHTTDYDSSSFLRSCSNDSLIESLGALSQLWTGNNDIRLRHIDQRLYNAISDRAVDVGSNLATTLGRLVGTGQLTFDKNNPGTKFGPDDPKTRADLDRMLTKPRN